MKITSITNIICPIEAYEQFSQAILDSAKESISLKIKSSK